MLLAATIRSVISPRPQPSESRHLVSIFQCIAITYLQGKISSRTVDSNWLGLSMNDLALDSIADLFKRDEHGVFVTLKQYFESIDHEGMSEEQLLGACRRLVFSKVNQELYRQYKEHDPDLHRIIRNLKDAVPHIPVVRLELRGGENTLVFGGYSGHLPTISPEILEAYLTEEISARMTTREILLAAAQVFAGQDMYKREFPFTGFALLVRAAFVNREVSTDEGHVEPTNLTRDELRCYISESVRQIADQMKDGYVGKNKVNEEIYSSYFQTIGEILWTEYVQNDGNAESYYSYLLAQIPELTKDEYRNEHRTVLEYLAKLTRKDFLERVRKELES